MDIYSRKRGSIIRLQRSRMFVGPQPSFLSRLQRSEYSRQYPFISGPKNLLTFIRLLV